MSDTSVTAARGETRQCMIRVWMAISAVWTAFWLALALLCLAAPEFRSAVLGDFTTFCIIVLTPPVVLLGLGALARLLFEALSRPSSRGIPSR